MQATQIKHQQRRVQTAANLGDEKSCDSFVQSTFWIRQNHVKHVALQSFHYHINLQARQIVHKLLWRAPAQLVTTCTFNIETLFFNTASSL